MRGEDAVELGLSVAPEYLLAACEVHNPSYDFNDAALPYGASLFARLVEKRLAK
jgi:hypothetical protein